MPPPKWHVTEDCIDSIAVQREPARVALQQGDLRGGGGAGMGEILGRVP
eukprot:COSAG05_NODE_280_length_12288_cov_4.797933_13_plen_49_part_00